MAAKKINLRMAQTIADAIADKAFEHLINPKQAALASIADEALAIIYKEVDIDLLLRFNIIAEAESMRVKIRAQSDTTEDSAVRVTTTNGGFAASSWEGVTVTDDVLWAQARDLTGELAVLTGKRNALRGELHAQLDGKTTMAAVKAWPEAEDLINKVAGITGNAGFTVPLENMLAKYLPMLAAPQGD